MEDELLPVLLKLVNGNKEVCFELIKQVRQKHPGQPMHWCIQKAIYDARYRASVPPPKPTAPAKTARWGLYGVSVKSSAEEPLRASTRDLQALLKAKRKMAQSQPSSEASRRHLFKLCKGDIDQARRLVQRVRVANPDRSEQWAVEKVIYDLERDRR